MQRKIFLFRPRFIVLFLILILVSGILGANLWVGQVAKNKIFREAVEIKDRQIVLVLGAGVKQNGELTDILRDRLDSAIELFVDKKVLRIIVSGDNSRTNYDETDAMRDYLLKQNIPPRAIFTDYAGFDTFDSIYRAREIFGATKLVIVSQEFHLPRAIFLAEKLGIEAVGFSANLRAYTGQTRLNLREIFANVKAVGDILLGTKPHFLGDKFELTGDGRESWAEQ
ncbi:MAG: ElyC/SanA/YdcF family protein [Patescibacteria group bacterium]